MIEKEVATQIGICTVVFSCFLLILCIIHKFQLWDSVYYTSTRKETSRKFFAWIKDVVFTSDKELNPVWGTDGAAIMAIIDFCIIFFFTVTLILGPTTYLLQLLQSQDKEGIEYYLADVFRIKNENFLYIHVVYLYIIIIVFHLLVKKGYKTMFQAKRDVARSNWDASCVLILENVPAGSTQENLKEYLESIRAGKVESVFILKNHPQLRAKIKQRFRTILDIEHYCCVFPSFLVRDCFFEVFDENNVLLKNFKKEISSCTHNLRDKELLLRSLRIFEVLEMDIQNMRINYDRDAETSDCAVVRFSHPSEASLASRALISSDPRYFRVKPAPHSEDFQPCNLMTNQNGVRIRRIFCTCFIFLALAETGLISINIIYVPDSIAKYLDIQNELLTKLLSFVPVLIINMYMGVFPIILRRLAKEFKFTSVLRENIVCFVVWIYFLVLKTGVTIGTVSKNQYEEMTQDYFGLFIIVFILFHTFVFCPLLIMRVPSLFLKILRSINPFTWQTPRQKQETLIPPVFQFIQFGSPIFIFMIGISLCLFYPVINPLILSYAIMVKFTWKYHLLYQVKVPDSRGKLWHNLISAMHVSMIFCSLLLLVLGVYKNIKFQIILPVFAYFVKQHFKFKSLRKRLVYESLEIWKNFEVESKTGNVDANIRNPSACYQGIEGMSGPKLDSYEDLLRNGELPLIWIK